MTQERDTAKLIVEYLEYGAAGLDDKTAAKLAAARHRAVAAMPAPVHVVGSEFAHEGWGRVGHYLHGRQAWMTVLLTVATILMALALVQKNTNVEPVDDDAMLLASDLPPEAYVDKGFNAWLENSSRP